MPTLNERLTALEADMATVMTRLDEHDDLFALPRERNEVFRVTHTSLWSMTGAVLVTVGSVPGGSAGLYYEVDTETTGVEIEFYVSGLAVLSTATVVYDDIMSAAVQVGTSITVDDVSSEHPPITVVPGKFHPARSPIAYPAFSLKKVLEQGTGIHEVTAQLLITGAGDPVGPNTLYVDGSLTKVSMLRGLRL